MPPIYLTSDLLSYKRKPNLFNPVKRSFGDPYLDNVVLYLKGDGTNGSTNIIDESPTPKSISVFGNTQISTAQSKYGGSSIIFDGSGDELQVPYDSSMELGSEWTIEFYTYITSHKNYHGFFSNVRSNTNGTGIIRILSTSTGLLTVSANNFSSPILLSQWCHVAISKSASNMIGYLNGQEGFNVSDTDNYTLTNYWQIGSIPSYGLNGYIDSFRITKGVARYTANFDPETDTYLAY